MDETAPAMPLAERSNESLMQSTRQRRYALLAGASLVVWGVLLTPVANNPWAPVPGYMTAFGSAMFVTNAFLAALLFNRGLAEQNAASCKLGAAYFFVAAIFLPLMAAFPGAFVAGNLVGEPVSSVWLWSFWHAGFAALILRYALDFHRKAVRLHRKRMQLVQECICIVVVVFALAWVATQGLAWLPGLFTNGMTFFEGPMRLLAWGVLGLNVAALISVLAIQAKTAEQVWLAVGMIAACLDVWLTFHGANRFSVGWYLSKMGSLLTTMVVLMSQYVDLTSLYKRVSDANAALERLASRDGLTGLANRRRFDEILAAEWRRAQRQRQSLALLMLDVDHFKLYNDTYGHLGGDDCLRRVADVIATQGARPGDLAARYGGEEFAVILPNTDSMGAGNLATRIRDGVQALDLEHTHSRLQKVTISIGVAVVLPNQESQPKTLVALADQALYQAKHLGRNRVQFAQEEIATDGPAMQGAVSHFAVGVGA